MNTVDDLFETYTEYRLTGQPPGGYPRYDFTARDADDIAAIKKIWEAADGRNWTDVRFTTRQVTITRTEWTDYKPEAVTRRDPPGGGKSGA